MIKTINPTTEEIIKEYPQDSEDICNLKIKKSLNKYNQWKNSTFELRREVLIKLASLFDERKLRLAELMAIEMGKPIAQGIAEAQKCSLVCKYYAENGEKFLADMPIVTEMHKSYVTFKPIGPVLAIMPWNFPFWQVMRFAAPAVIAGNTILLKHSSVTMGCSLEIENMFNECGAEDLLISLIIDSKPVANIINSRDISAVTFTGSTSVGRKVAATAGEALKKSVLELGGSDPYLILEDANLVNTAKLCAKARLINNGQSCIAAKRFIAVGKIYEEFAELLNNELKNQKLGNPLSEDTTLGPIATNEIRNELIGQLNNAKENGAIIMPQNNDIFDKGWFLQPATIINVTNKANIYYDETFGPLATVIYAKDEQEAIDIANSTSFGLGGAVFSSDLDKAEKIASEKIETGTCFVNDFVRSDPRMPFGGIKDSGFGRELSEFGLYEFVNIKTICVNDNF